jgi:peptidoglycan hydrolase-like protein with peptidoglycan-binding domain
MPTTTLQPWPPLKKGGPSHLSAAVTTLQYLLRAHGYTLEPDGIFGPITDSAVRDFQAKHGLAVDGIVGPMTWSAVVIEVRQGDEGNAVRGVQFQLFVFRNLSDVDLSAQVDGIFGPITDEAVRGFQAALALDHPEVVADGIVGPITWRALVSGMLSF